MFKLWDLNIGINLDDKWLKKEFSDVSNQVKKEWKKINKETKNISSWFSELKWVIIWAFSIWAIIQFWKKLLGLWSDLTEISSKFNTIFSWIEWEAETRFNNIADAVWRSRLEIIDFWSSLADVLKPMWFTTSEALKLSENMTKLAIDVASFNNVSDTQAIDAFKSALTWERESLKSLWIVINEADLKTEAYTSWIAKQWTQLTKQQKTLATYNLLLKNTADAQWDAVRTAWSFANQWKRLTWVIKDSFATAWKDIAQDTSWLLKTISNFFAVYWTLIIKTVGEIWKTIWNIIWNALKGWNILSNWFTSFTVWIFSDAEKESISFWKSIALIINTIWKWLKWIILAVKNAWETIWAFVSWTARSLNALKNLDFKWIWTAFTDEFKIAWDNILANNNAFKNDFIGSFDEILSADKDKNKKIKDSYSTLFDNISNMADKYSKYSGNAIWKGVANGSKKTKEELKKIKTALKSLDNRFKETWKSIEDSISKSKNKIEEFTNSIKKSKNELGQINNQIKNLWNEKATTLSERNLEILKEQKQIKEDLATLRKDRWQTDYLQKENDLLSEYNKLQEEKKLIQENTTQQQRDEAKRIAWLSISEKYLEEYKKKEVELEAKKQKKEEEIVMLQEQKSQEEEILKVFNDAKWQMNRRYAMEKMHIEQTITADLKKNNIQRIDSLKLVEQQAIKTAKALREQASAIRAKSNASKTSWAWFSNWWYTWNGWKNDVAWVVHKWEYVIPKNMVSALPNLIWGLENMRTWWNISNDNSRKLEVWNVNVNSSMDINEAFNSLLWQLN